MKLKIRYIALLVLLLSFIESTQSQSIDEKKIIVTKAVIYEGDTIPSVDLQSVLITGPRIFKNQREAIKYSKLIRDVKKVYPYAKLAGIKFKEYSEKIMLIKSEKQRKNFMKYAEKQLVKEFEGDVRKMTMRQGIILIKLIDRETGNTSYEIIKEFRGRIMAFFWQSIGSVFGINLKLDYQPEGRDKYIEEIVIMIENGTV